MRRVLIMTVLLCVVLSPAILAAGSMSVDVNGGYILATREGSEDFEAPSFFFGAGTQLTEAIGARFFYQTGKVDGSEWSVSNMEILGSYKVLSTDKYAVSAIGGWKTITDEYFINELKASGLAFGGEITVPFNETVSLGGTLLLVPSLNMKFGDTEEVGTARKLEVAGTISLPQLPVKVLAGYRSDLYKQDSLERTVCGLFIGARASF